MLRTYFSSEVLEKYFLRICSIYNNYLTWSTANANPQVLTSKEIGKIAQENRSGMFPIYKTITNVALFEIERVRYTAAQL